MEARICWEFQYGLAKQYNKEQNIAMNLKICNNTDLNIKHRSTYVYIMYMDMSKYNLGRQPNYYM
jgi:hypothetical protein